MCSTRGDRPAVPTGSATANCPPFRRFGWNPAASSAVAETRVEADRCRRSPPQRWRCPTRAPVGSSSAAQTPPAAPEPGLQFVLDRQVSSPPGGPGRRRRAGILQPQPPPAGLQTAAARPTGRQPSLKTVPLSVAGSARSEGLRYLGGVCEFKGLCLWRTRLPQTSSHSHHISASAKPQDEAPVPIGTLAEAYNNSLEKLYG